MPARLPRSRSAMRILIALNFAVVALFAGATPAGAAPGDLDTTYGNAGSTLFQFGVGSSPNAYNYNVERAPDGKIVTAGAASDTNGSNSVLISRQLADGTLDFSFGSGGRIVPQLGEGPTPSSSVVFNGLAIQADGKIVVAGAANNAANQTASFVARFLTNGNLDPTFDGDGKFLIQLGAGATPGSQFYGVTIQPDGKILATGYRTTASNGNEATIVRLTSSGGLDFGFGAAGIFASQFGDYTAIPANNASTGVDLAVQSDGKIVTAGQFDDTADKYAFGIARVTANGTVDSSFGSGGSTVTQASEGPTPGSTGLNLDQLSTGQFVVGGVANDSAGGTAMAVARYTSGGVADLTFGPGTGRVLHQLSPVTPNPTSVAYGMVTQPNDRVVLVGAFVVSGSTTPQVLVRLLPNGSLDPSFAGTGVAQANFGIGTNPQTIGIDATLTADGKIVTGGIASVNPPAETRAMTSRWIYTTPPSASFSVPTGPVNVGASVALNGSASSDADGTISKYSWDLDADGAYNDATGVAPSTTFSSPGTKTIGLEVRDDNNVAATTTRTVNIVAVPVVPGDTVDPVITAFKMTNKKFAVGPRPTALTAAKAKKGTKFRWKQSETATVVITIAREFPGRRKGKKCVKPTPKRKKKCVRLKTQGKLIRKNLSAGSNSLAFSGRLGTKKLAPGRYVATIIATDAAGNTSTKRRHKFKIVRR